MQCIAFTIVLSLLVMVPTLVYAEHLFENQEAFAQYLETITATGKSYVIEVDDNTFEIFYGATHFISHLINFTRNTNTT